MSYLNFASAGPAFPESYVHQDGTTYKGEWDGLHKHGVGVYKYESNTFNKEHFTIRYKNGDIYEGEWRKNQKSGRGVYIFANVRPFRVFEPMDG